MKKSLPILVAALMLSGVSTFCVFAEEASSADVTVTVANAGTLTVAAKTVHVTDADGDGALTINDTLILAHESYYEGGSEAGYASATTEWGLSITKLWGVENGGSYGYYLNDAMSMGLTDPVKSGDRLTAFVYADTTAFSDAYSFFSDASVTAVQGEKITLTLMKAGFDENWNPVTLPVSGAVITVDGTDTTYTTDAEGKVTLTLTQAGEHILSAKSDSETLVPPVCTATVEVSDAPATGDLTLLTAASGVLALFVASVAVLRRRMGNED